MDLPLLADLDVENLMKVREEDGEAFANFRFALDHKLSSLREISDMQTAKRMAKEAVAELTEVQFHDVRQKVRSLREKMGISAVLSVALRSKSGTFLRILIEQEIV